MASRRQIARDLGAALLAGPWSADAMTRRAQQLFGAEPAWLPPLITTLLERYGSVRAPAPESLVRFIASSPLFASAWQENEGRPVIRRYPLDSPQFGPRPGFVTGALPALATTDELAGWLQLPVGRLLWLADCEGRQRHIDPGPLRHYRYRWVDKRDGTPRLLEVPKAQLKAIQRRLLRDILDPVPPHPAAHGFRRGRSCRSYAAGHCGRALLLRLDLKDFFTSIAAARIHALFRTLGYPWAVARLLTGLCTNTVAADPFKGSAVRWARRQTLQFAHLPQGAPTSPALANLVAYSLDRRLSGLALQRGLHYTRYADDLAFSGAAMGPRALERLQTVIGAIVLEQGLALNHRKTRVMRQSQAQRLTGIAVNRFGNIPRDQYDALKATLFNCVRDGAEAQNRERHPDFRAQLRGRIDYVASLNPGRAQRLRQLFERIDWSGVGSTDPRDVPASGA